MPLSADIRRTHPHIKGIKRHSSRQGQGPWQGPWQGPDALHHRSRKRINELGEVFTPPRSVAKMLKMLPPSIWSSEETVFFEPTCGHGNFVVAIVKKRCQSLFKKYQTQIVRFDKADQNLRPFTNSRLKSKQDELAKKAIANALNTLWAIDINAQNIQNCRERAFECVLDFFVSCRMAPPKNISKKKINLRLNPSLRSRLYSTPQQKANPDLNTTQKADLYLEAIEKDTKFWAHILCCLNTQIHQNEIITSLQQDTQSAKVKSLQTATSKKWIKRHGHTPIDFNNTWAHRLSVAQKQSIVSLEYKRTLKTLNNILKDGQAKTLIKPTEQKSKAKAKLQSRLNKSFFANADVQPCGHGEFGLAGYVFAELKKEAA